MNTIVSIMSFSAVMWYLIDRIKPLWAELSWGKYLTCALSAAAAFTLTFVFSLDLLSAMELTGGVTVVGQILTVLTLMSGSSAVSELVERLKR